MAREMAGLRCRCRCGWRGDSGECDHRLTGEHCPKCDEPIESMGRTPPAGKPDPALVEVLGRLMDQGRLTEGS